MDQKEIITQQQADALSMTDLSAEMQEKIRIKYWELVKQFPQMKRHRLMRKAGEFYKIKFVLSNDFKANSRKD